MAFLPIGQAAQRCLADAAPECHELAVFVALIQPSTDECPTRGFAEPLFMDTTIY
jgi:hypothetical protein